MRVRLLATGEGSLRRLCFLTSFLINDRLAVDAGSLGFALPLDDQARIRHVLLTHSHIDHLASLPLFVENAYRAEPECVTIHGHPAVLECLQAHLFNDQIWPDFIALSRSNPPFLKLSPLEPGTTLELEGLRITPIAVNHVVPTLGFVLEGPGASVILPSDTGPTQNLWDLAQRVPNLKAIFLEAAFPDRLEWLAKLSGHLTPAQFAGEARKLPQGARLIAVHLKARHHGEIAAELAALGVPQIEVIQPGKDYDF